mmetsp:Transcript_42273/g.59180  ORF Transcript_42273/g.59180 Transcript_42273/m.59180 type:complete len:212 (-) Transcript_42273:160-795(-)|eukprot:CAMPEP_0201482986 /NCGR_PEP_ID=MMETSP0151_2-20130828/7225_1 /ASSEMBLY_ACC=CAM_ASM_000257 /TAXON_ID=200890 /ORGANISM="Paramoeba atlantica, Strain 621/1 / CCAP 1560/9" /LENGTH=211 /DNA_ID=CAMNT_0047865921 /DNA_START=127 /DNA_END=762 /DNA_ORIENTATION=-
MDIFFDYEREFASTSKDVTKLISQLPNLPPQQKNSSISNIQRMLRDMDDMLGKMEESARDSGQRGMLESNLKRKGQELQRLRRDLTRKTNESAPTTEQEDFDRRAKTQRERLLEGVDQIDESGQRLQNALSIGQENEELAADTLGTLHQQRGTLEDDKRKIDEINDQMVVADSTVGDMARRALSDKIILVIANVLLLALNLVLLYFLLFAN